MKTLFCIAFVYLISITSFCQNITQISNQQWVHDFVQVKISEKVSAGIDLSLRWKDNFTYFNQYLSRVHLNYKINNHLKAGAGITASGYYSFGIPKTFEWRFHQDFISEWKKDKTTLTFRYRIEERFMRDHITFNEYNNRFYLRNRFSAGFLFKICNLSKKENPAEFWFYLGEEFFFNLNKLTTPTFFDQNRILAGPVFKLNKSHSIQLNYNFQLLGTDTTNEFKLNNTIWLIFRHQLDWQ